MDGMPEESVPSILFDSELRHMRKGSLDIISQAFLPHPLPSLGAGSSHIKGAGLAAYFFRVMWRGCNDCEST